LHPSGIVTGMVLNSITGLLYLSKPPEF